ncbi:MAG: DUF177 domain-containing protein [Bacteroidota bacterium]
MAEFRINISNLSEGIHDYVFESEAQMIGLGPEYTGPIRVQASLEKGRRQMLLRVSVNAAAEFICDRCLDPFTKNLKAKYIIVYAPGDRSMTGVQNESNEIQVLSPDMNFIDLDEDVRQYLVLDVPQKLLCSEECEGICPQCGARKNKEHCHCTTEEIDTRWESLKKLSGK